MASTLKLGNGNWGVKEDSLLAYSDKNNNFLPLPFDFSRASSATVVNKAGLIETVGSGEPRIDFKDDTKGALLLEPQSTNLVTQSELFSDASWVKSGLTVNSNQITSPSGNLTADLLIEGNSNSGHDIRYNANLPYNTYIYSVFVKKYNGGGDRNLRFLIGGVNTSGSFNLSTGLWSAATFDNPTAIDFGNGWWKLSFSDIGVAFNVITQLTNNGNVSYQGDGVSGVYIWGAQLEQNSFSTSYIQTQGSTSTRIAETCTNSGSAQDFNSEEGVLYAEISALGEDNVYRIFGVSNGTTQNRLSLGYTNNNQLFFGADGGGNYEFEIESNAIITDNNKIALRYNSDNITLFLNGIKTIEEPNGVSFDDFTKLNFNGGNGSQPFNGNIKELQVFTKALSDEELIELTKI